MQGKAASLRDPEPELRILILEDNPYDAELIQFELREAGLSFVSRLVDTEESFKKALQKFSPDLILSDYDLPQYEGLLALADAKKSCPGVPFILVTGAVTEDRAIEVLTSGARDYVLKNRLQRLGPAVKRALTEAEEHKARKKAEEDLREAHKNLERKVEERTRELQAEIAERKRVEEALRRTLAEAQERDRLLQRMQYMLSEGERIAHLGTFEYLAETKATIWSDEECRIFGLDLGEPSPSYNDMLAKFIHPEDAALLHETFTEAMQTGSVYELEHRIVRPDGSVRWVYDRAHPYFDETGRLTRYVGATLDITERKKGPGEGGA